jgi:hypothetical protein
MTLALPIIMLIASAPGDAPMVRYVTKVVTKSWQPLELKDVERMIEASALEQLTRGGAMRLEASSYADLKTGDYTLTIDGRFIEEAEKFSVYLTFGSAKRDDLPSFHVSDTDSIGKLPREQMQKRIEALAKRAGTQLMEALGPLLESARLHVVAPPIDQPTLPWEWGPIEVPDVRSPSKAIRELLEVKNPDHVRYAGLEAIKGQAFDQPAARDAIVLCTLRDPLPRLRASCAEALAPVARAHVPTQRVLLLAMRNEIDEQVLQALTSLAKDFVGLSRKESVETWLEIVASEATPGSAVDHVARLLAEEGDVPNLDLTIAKCLQEESLAQGKKHACAGTLLRNVPPQRRLRIVWKYLEQISVFEQGEQNNFDELKDNLFRTKIPYDAAFAELLLKTAERRSAGFIRGDLLYHYAEYAPPSPNAIERIVQLAREPRLTRMAARAIDELVHKSKDDAIRVMALGALKRLAGDASFIRGKFGGDPRRELMEEIERLDRAKR